MSRHWKSNPHYKNHGVDGSVCSFREYLSSVEQFCPRLNDDEDCGSLTGAEMKSYPHCKGKLGWMSRHWKSNPHYKNHGVDGSVCSFREYLSEVENFCPEM